MPAVLVVSMLWGRAFGIATSLLSAAAFNFFHLPPGGRFSLSDEREWVALVVFVIVAVATGMVGELARARGREAEQRRQEADLSAEMAQLLLGTADVEGMLEEAAARLAAAVGVRGAAISVEELNADGHSLVFDAGRRRRAGRGAEARRGALTAGARADRRARRALARVDPQRRAEPRRAAGRGRRDRGTAPQRRAQDGGAAVGLARPAHPPDGDPDGDHGAGPRAAHSRERRRRARAGDRRGDSPVAPDREAARPLRAAGGPRRAAPGVVLDRRGARGGDRAGGRRRRTLQAVGRAGDAAAAGATLPSSSGRSRTCSRTRRATAAGSPCRYVRASCEDVSACSSSIRAPGSRRASRSGSSFRSTARRTRPSAHPGSGLGLAITKGFLELNGGRISVESLPGQGTSFVVEFPVAEQPPEPLAASAAPQGSAG